VRGDPLGLGARVGEDARCQRLHVVAQLRRFRARRFGQLVGLGARVVDELLRERARVVLVTVDHAARLHGDERITSYTACVDEPGAGATTDAAAPQVVVPHTGRAGGRSLRES